jgi:hypothetical protein
MQAWPMQAWPMQAWPMQPAAPARRGDVAGWSQISKQKLAIHAIPTRMIPVWMSPPWMTPRCPVGMMVARIRGRRFARTLGIERSIEQLDQPRKIEGGLARFLQRKEAGPPRLDGIRLAVKCAKPPALGVFDGIAVVQFAHLPRREPKPCYGASVGHVQ